VATFEHKLEFDLEMQSALLSEAEGEFYLGDLLNHSGQLAEAEKHLQKAITLDPNLAIANASLGMLEMRREHYAEARRYLERAVAANSDNYLVHYYYAYVMGQQLFGSGNVISSIEPSVAQKLRTELKRTIELAPNFAEAYRFLGFVNLVAGEELDESIKLLQHAVELIPGEQEFGYILAQLYLRKQDYKAARELLEPIVRSSGTEAELRARSQSLLDSINSIEETITRYKSGAGESVEGSGQPPPPGVIVVGNEKGQMKSREEAITEAINQALRQPQEGEVRVRGQLLRIDCGNEIYFSVQTEGRALKLTTKKFEAIKFTSYLPDFASEITCGVRKPVDDVVIVYKPLPNAKGKAEGEVISVEFVPKDFKLKQ
jgi:tetratricopeptide (TPR) repeat protein